MQTSPTDLFTLAEHKLGWLEDRQRILARNIANSDTPNYQPQDEQPFASVLLTMNLAPVQASPMQIALETPQLGVIAEQTDGRAPDGNQVSVEQEMTKVADTDNQQRFVTNIYSKYMSMFAMALGKG